MEEVASDPLCGLLGFVGGRVAPFPVMSCRLPGDWLNGVRLGANLAEMSDFHRFETAIHAFFHCPLVCLFWMISANWRLVSISNISFPSISHTSAIMFLTLLVMVRRMVWEYYRTNTILIRNWLDSLGVSSGGRVELIESVCSRQISAKSGCKLRAWVVWIGSTVISCFSPFESQSWTPSLVKLVSFVHQVNVSNSYSRPCPDTVFRYGLCQVSQSP